MPGMMDTILNLGLNETSLQGPDQADRQRALCLRRLSPLHPAVRQDRARHQRRAFRRDAWPRSSASTARAGSGPERRASEGTGRRVPRHRQAPHRQAVPARSLRAAGNRGRRGVPLLDGQARGGLPQAVQDHQGPGQRHRGQRLHHGVRQHGQRFRHRRGLHAQPRHRRERDLRRIPDQCAGRRRGGGHPHAQGRSPRWNRKCRRSTAS